MTPPGVDPVEPAQSKDGPLRIAFSEREEKGALRLFLRALRRLPDRPRLDRDDLLREPG